MKDFFEDLGKRIGETAETMTNMAGEAIEIQRLKSQIRTLARGNAVDLMELGKSIYDRYKASMTVIKQARKLRRARRGSVMRLKTERRRSGNMRRKFQKLKVLLNVLNAERW